MLEVRPSCEPSNLVWENLEIPRAKQNWSRFKMLVVVFMFFGGMVVGFVSLKTLVNKSMDKSAKGIDCSYIKV